MTNLIRAPFTAEQVQALNRFQQHGGMHPFTCGAFHGGSRVVLIAHSDGWHCSEPSCDYRQDWAHAFMAQPEAWPNQAPADRGLRDRYAAALRRVMDYRIVAEWICCDPINPGHKLCKKGHAARKMVRALLDDDGAYPSHVLDALMAVRDSEVEQLRAAIDGRHVDRA